MIDIINDVMRNKYKDKIKRGLLYVIQQIPIQICTNRNFNQSKNSIGQIS